MCMACDIRIASAIAKFGQPEVKLGLIPGFGATQRLVQHVGFGNALYLLTSGRNISAGEAQRMGLVQEITEPDQLMKRVHELAGEILAVGHDAVKKVKSVIRKSASMSLPAGYELESNEFGTLFEGEREEGMKAFLEKRKPAW